LSAVKQAPLISRRAAT